MSPSNVSGSFSSYPSYMEDIPVEICSSTWQQRGRKLSPEHNAAMRRMIRPWAGTTPSPPGCRSIMSSSWSKFSTSMESTKSRDEMKASIILRAKGTTPDFCPPPSEWAYLGTSHREPVPIGKSKVARDATRSKTSSASSWATESTLVGSANAESITFRKQMVRGTSTTSLLTASLKSRPGPGGQQPRMSAKEMLAQEMGLMKLSSSMLTSAFDSDSEEED
ncbi:hypothetical protein BDV96DRAFT_650528 [Lophiotrema nucula]|uniref:Uncharacterized protein n=1 Tax=Lophiotrema nucula TaxID=690887 RepID=A0A6A5YUV0_9PLEO|nr:hypothetical protein BDV96DRAFT_650528 [Lophiotrema nucula]